jgi:hypothetical protein
MRGLEGATARCSGGFGATLPIGKAGWPSDGVVPSVVTALPPVVVE